MINLIIKCLIKMKKNLELNLNLKNLKMMIIFDDYFVSLFHRIKHNKYNSK